MRYKNWQTSTTWAALPRWNSSFSIFEPLYLINFSSPCRTNRSRPRIRLKRLCSQGSCERSSEKSKTFLWITNTQHVCHQMQFGTNYLRHSKVNDLKPCSYRFQTWNKYMDFLHRKRVKQEKKKTSGLNKKGKKQADESWNQTWVH